MHDRRIEGKAHVFGNFGKLYLKAMTWWDHETGSVWSQPLGQALKGPYKGTRLEMIPVAVLPWKSWRNEHPDTLVLKVDNPFEPVSQRVVGGDGEHCIGWSDPLGAGLACHGSPCAGRMAVWRSWHPQIRAEVAVQEVRP